MLKLQSGVSRAVLSFLLVGIVLPLLLNYLEPLFATIGLPFHPPPLRWAVLIGLGVAVAVFEFLSGGFERRAWQWLVGQLGASFAWFLVLFYLIGPIYGMPPARIEFVGSLGESTTRVGVEADELLFLIAVLLVLGMLTPVFQFQEARRISQPARNVG